MTLSEAEIRAIVEGAADACSVRPPGAVELRRMLCGLTDFEFRAGQATPLVKLCETGARYGWRDLEAAINPNLLTQVSQKARASLTRDLRRSLERLTRPCLELERTSFGLAMTSIGILGGPSDKMADRIFLGDKPSHRLFSLFKKFPILARLWSQLIFYWCRHVTEVLSRFMKDRSALSRAFLDGRPIKRIADVRCSLSDPHRHGRTVMQLSFGAGAVIYKPRPGNGEWEWSSLVKWMNAQSFQPRLRSGRVLRRKGYCWMERIEAAPCQKAAARRFYERMGGMIAAACLVKAVDCHRDNIIISGEDPVLVDADALWHVSPGMKTQTPPLDVLYRTGFFPNSNPRSLQSRSSALRRPQMVQYRREMINGFTRAWDCILGTKERRRAFAKRLRRIQAHERRWIYRATEQYAAIRRASVQPVALRSGVERHRIIARFCRHAPLASEAIDAEIRALKRLDIPYFVRTGKKRIVLNKASMLATVQEALRRVLV